MIKAVAQINGEKMDFFYKLITIRKTHKLNTLFTLTPG